MCVRSAQDFFLKIFSNFSTLSRFLSLSLSLCARLRLAQGSAEQYVDPFASLKSRCKEFILDNSAFKSSSPNEIRQTRKEEESVDFTRALRRRSLSLFLSEVILSHRARACRIGSDIDFDHGAGEIKLLNNKFFCHHCQSANSSKDYIFFLIRVRERNVANPRRAFGMQIFQHFQMPVTSGTSHRPLVPRRVRYFVKIL